MKLFSTHPRNRKAWQAATLTFVLLAALALSTVFPIIRAHAQQC